ncbi:MAG: vWA domain-containing protein [Phototrophicaceae bacterium]
MTLLAPLALLGLLLAIPILLLYMLRLRRREVVVSSNFLWQQVVQDTEANTPWQRLRRNLLLILQLIILTLLVLALLRPAQIVPQLVTGRTVLLIDASASMNATDGENAQTRFEEARTTALQLASELNPGDEMSVIRVADVTETLIEYTADFQTLRAAIVAAEPGQGGGDWETALTLAAAGAAGTEFFTTIVLTDGGIDAAARLPENIPAPIVLTVGNSSENLAITGLATRAQPGENPELFAQVRHYGSEEARVTLTIRLDGVLWDSETRTIAPRSQTAFSFPTIEQPFSTVQASLSHEAAVIDHLALDDTAFATAAQTGTRRALLVSQENNLFIAQVLRALPGVETFRGDPSRTTLPEQAYDFYVFDGWLPDVLPQADMLIINPPENTALFSIGESSEATEDRVVLAPNHPVLRFVDWPSVNIRAYRPLANIGWAEVLAEAPDGPLVIAGQDSGRQIVVLPFDVRDSDLPLQIAWPVLMSNIVDWFTPVGLVPVEDSVAVGELLRISLPAGSTAAQVRPPSGDVITLPAGEGDLTFTETHQPGLYTISALDNGAVLQEQPVAVTLFGGGQVNESDITPQPAAQIDLGGGAVDAEAREEAQRGFQEWWPIAALLALLFLLIEWVAYHQRLRVPTLGVAVRRPLQRSTART